MDTLEEKLLEKMAHRHFKREMLGSVATAATALSSWVACSIDCKSHNKLADKNIQKLLANMELHIQLLEKSYYPNIQEVKKQIVQEIAKKYGIL